MYTLLVLSWTAEVAFAAAFAAGAVLFSKRGRSKPKSKRRR